MIDPAVFRAMVANGATPEMLLAVVEAAAAVEEEKREAKRAGNAERQRRFRERNAGNALQGVTERDGVTETPSPSPSSSPDPSNNPTPAPVNIPRARKAAPVGHRLPTDWQPEPLTGDIADAVAKWPPGACDRELARFRDWAAGATGPNAKKSDWQATFRNWLRRADDDGKYRNEPIQRHRGTPSRPGDGFGAALREMSGAAPPHH